MLHHKSGYLCPVKKMSAFQIQGGSFVRHFFRKTVHIYIDPDANDRTADLILFHGHLGKDPTDFFAGNYHVIRPFDSYIKTKIRNCLCNRKSHNKCHHRRFLRRKFRAEKNAHGDGTVWRCTPPSCKTSTACRLILCHKKLTMSRSFFLPGTFAPEVGGINFSCKMDGFARPFCMCCL